jgi:hypothetical protein
MGFRHIRKIGSRCRTMLMWLYIESMNTFRKERAVRTRLKIEIHIHTSKPPYLGDSDDDISYMLTDYTTT